MNTLTAEAFAIQAHEGQLYGDKPYYFHLKAVVDILISFGYEGHYLNAGWLHDIIENTNTSPATVIKLFGADVFVLVDACTGVGETRKDRNRRIYGKINFRREAAVVKVADRIANVEASDKFSDQFKMYSREREAFYLNVARYVPVEMQERLSDAYEK